MEQVPHLSPDEEIRVKSSIGSPKIEPCLWLIDGGNDEVTDCFGKGRKMGKESGEHAG
jgi:hypothetical protein